MRATIVTVFLLATLGGALQAETSEARWVKVYNPFCVWAGECSMIYDRTWSEEPDSRRCPKGTLSTSACFKFFWVEPGEPIPTSGAMPSAE